MRRHRRGGFLRFGRIIPIVLGVALLAAGVPASADPAPPPAPTNLRVLDHDQLNVSLDWDSSEPENGYTNFYIYADGHRVGREWGSEGTICCLHPGQTYDITVTVQRGETAGGPPEPESAPSAPVRVTMDPDTTPPSTPTGFKLRDRPTTSTLDFFWDWTDDDTYVAKWQLSYAGRTHILDHAYPGHRVDVSALDLTAGRTYPFELRAIDAGDNVSATPARFTFETTPPTAPTNLRLVSSKDGVPDVIAWDAATDNSGELRDHRIYLNGELFGLTHSGSNQASLVDLLNEGCVPPDPGPVAVEVQAVDPSLNLGPRSAPITVTFPELGLA